MSEPKVYSKEEMEMWIKVLAKEIPVHQTSPETQAKFDKLYTVIHKLEKSLSCAAHTKMIDRHEKAIFGDRTDDTNPGMKIQVDEIHKFFIGAKGMSKLIVWTFGGFGAIAAGAIAIRTFFKSIVS